MPFRYLSEQNQFKLMKASIAVPLFIFAFGCLLSLYVGYSIHKNEIKARDAGLYSSAKEYSKQFELNVLNNILRIQSLIDVYGSTASKIVHNKQSVEEILRNSFFQRISIFKKIEINPLDGLPVLKRVSYRGVKSDELPDPPSAYLTSPYLREKVRSMDKRGEPSGFTINQSELGYYVVLIWRIPERNAEYALFTAPLKSIFIDSPIATDLKIFVNDPDTRLSFSVSWNEKGVMEVVSGRNFDTQAGNPERLLIENSMINSSSLEVTWYGNIDRHIGRLTLVVVMTGFLISLLFAFLLRFIISQNRLVANLVIKRTEDLEIALNEATVANLAKSRFLGNMSHELRTPLNLILGMLDLVHEKNNDKKISEYLKAIRVSGDHLLSLISDLLEMAQKDSGELKINTVPIRFPIFIEEIGQLIGPDARKKDLNFYIEIAADVPEAIRGDPGRVRQILMNLLRNSIKYTLKGSIYLKISCVRDRHLNGSPRLTLRMEVNDTGVGIPKGKQSQIFDRFLQLDSSKVLSQGGVGLGLSIVKDLVELMNGRISVESEIGKGSTFCIDLDFDVLNETPWAQLYRLKNRSVTPRVAVISDEPLFVRHIQDCLSSVAVSSIRINEEALMSKPLESWTHGYTHFIVDQNSPYDVAAKLVEKFRHQVIIIGNEKNSTLKNLNLKFLFMDSAPLIPTSLLAALGYARGESKSQALTTNSPEVTAPTKALQKSLSVLIADDDEGNRQLFAAYFADFGWTLAFSENGKDAFEKFKLNPPDVMIADLRMPIMDGFELTDQVRNFEALKKLKKTPIILVTADALDQTAELSRAHGVTSFLTKPIRKAKIIETVLSVVEHR